MNAVTENMPIIGNSLAGGFFGGIVNVNGAPLGVIWAPKNEGQISSILLPSSQMVEGAGSPIDSIANTKALLAAGSPAAKVVTELSINGFQDWVIPSRDVVELGYRHFKPTTWENYCSWRDGENSNSLPPGWLYTASMPTQTAIELFQGGGTEAFDTTWYWSSTALPNGNSAFCQGFHDGVQNSSDLSAELRVRAVRLIQLGS